MSLPSIDITAIERFVSLVKNASHTGVSGTSWIQMTMVDATAVTAEIAVVMSRLAALEHAAAEITAADGGTLR
jgi:hypothetical protein